MCTLKNWLRSLKVHPNFHIIRLNLSKNSPLVPPSKLAPPPRMIEAGQANTVKKLLAAANRGCSGQYLVEREVLNGRSWITYKERLWISASCIFNSSFRLSYVSKSSSWTKESVKWWGTVYVLFYLLLISQFLILCNISSFFFFWKSSLSSHFRHLFLPCSNVFPILFTSALVIQWFASTFSCASLSCHVPASWHRTNNPAFRLSQEENLRRIGFSIKLDGQFTLMVHCLFVFCCNLLL